MESFWGVGDMTDRSWSSSIEHDDFLQMIKKSYARVVFIDFEHVSLFNSLFWFYFKFPFFQKKKIEADPFQMTYTSMAQNMGVILKCVQTWRT